MYSIPRPARTCGFTLIEMLMVVSVIAILGALALPAYQSYVAKARSSELALKYDAVRTNVSVAVKGGVVHEQCAAVAANINPANLQSPYAVMDVAFEAVAGGFTPMLRFCADSGNQGTRGVDVARETHHLLSRSATIGQGAVIGEAAVSFAVNLADGAAVCRLAPPAAKGTGGCSGGTAQPAASVPAVVPPPLPLPPCPDGQRRSDADPTKCEALTPKAAAPSLKATQDFAPYPDPRFPELVPGESAVRGAGSCDSKIEFYISGGTTTRCVLDPQLVRVTVTNKPTAANNPCPKGYVFAPDDASTDFRTPAVGSCVAAGNHPAPYDPMTCQVCAGPEFLCEKLIEEGTCEYPNNFCVTTLTNRRDTSRTVIHRCGNYRDANNEWFLGSSDDDKCRQFDENNFYTVEMQCTYACIKDNCNAIINPTVGQTGKGSGGIMWFPTK